MVAVATTAVFLAGTEIVGGVSSSNSTSLLC